MPELLRAYGDILRPRHDAEFVFAVLVGVVLVLAATCTIGALIETAARAWKRSRDRRHA